MFFGGLPRVATDKRKRLWAPACLQAPGHIPNWGLASGWWWWGRIQVETQVRLQWRHCNQGHCTHFTSLINSDIWIKSSSREKGLRWCQEETLQPRPSHCMHSFHSADKYWWQQYGRGVKKLWHHPGIQMSFAVVCNQGHCTQKLCFTSSMKY